MLKLFSGALLLFMCSCGSSETHEAKTGSKDSATAIVEQGRVEILDAEALSLIDSTAKVESLSDGFEWSEGPLYIADGDYLLFSDIPRNKVFKWKEGEGLSMYLDSSGYTGLKMPEREPGSNGLLLDNKGNLVLCQHGNRQVARMLSSLADPKPLYQTIIDKYQGKRLNSPNDAVFHPNGDLYLTDPPYGFVNGDKDSAKEQDHHGVYRVKPNGKVDLVTKEFNYPNGIAVTPDGKYLLVAHSDSDNMIWMKYELNDQGLIKNKSVFYKVSEEEKKLPGAPDGFKINRNGYVFSSGPGGIWIFNPSGKPIARIYTGQATSNCAFGKDERSLFMTCDNFLYRINLK